MFGFHNHIQVIAHNTSIQRNSDCVDQAFSNLAKMCRVYLAAMGRVVLNLIIFNDRIFFYYYFRYLVRKAIRQSECSIGFYKLHLCIFTNIDKTSWL